MSELKDSQTASTSTKTPADGLDRFKRASRFTASLRLGFTAARNRHKKLPKIDISTPEFDELHQKHSTSSLSPTTLSKLPFSPETNLRKISGLAQQGSDRKISSTSNSGKSDLPKTQFCKVATEVALPSIRSTQPRLSINATLALEDTKREWTKRLSRENIHPASATAAAAATISTLQQQPKKFQVIRIL
uniref:Uncharacterized protein n=1 Tax=Panagrolaimus sp. PS1159 TaxID=55785 RepID=A0AC35FXE5_9BILA